MSRVPKLATALALCTVAGCSYRDDAHGVGSHGSVTDASPSDSTNAVADGGVDAAPDATAADHADAAVDAAAPPVDAPGPPPALDPVPSYVYPEGPRHSPIDAALAAHLQSIVAGNANVFGKVGDSISASTSFLNCFDGSYDLGTHTELAGTITFFKGGTAGGSTPFGRSSLSAISGSTTRDILTGNPSPLTRELTAIDPIYAVTMLGTNDIRFGRSFDAYGADLWTIVDRELAAGAIPILSTIPPINGDAGTDARIPIANRVIRAIAQGRRVPLVDFHRDMLGLPSRGISSDNIHPTVSPDGACQLTSAGLLYGYNLRNLITLEALTRARAALAGDASDASVATRAGNGRNATPIEATLPLADLGDSRTGDMLLTTYPCNSRPQAGREVVYRIDVPTAMTIDAYVVDRDNVDVDVHILQGALSATTCIAGGDQQASANVAAGTVYIVVDSPSYTTAGEYLLVVQQR